MKLRFLFPALALAFSPVVMAQEEAAPKVAESKVAELSPELLEKISYLFGVEIGTSLVQNTEFQVNLDSLFAGVKDMKEKGKPKYSEEEIAKISEQFSTIMQARQEASMKELAEKNSAAGKAFLAENGKREGIKTTASGLQYQVITQGKGAKPKATDTVSVHYHGTLIDGTVFDSSVQRGEPVEFPVNGVIPGWVEALQLMQEGSKYKLFIPADLAYGDRAVSPELGPNSTLIFEVELLKIVPAEAKAEAEAK